jgi:hypothetical protein
MEPGRASAVPYEDVTAITPWSGALDVAQDTEEEKRACSDGLEARVDRCSRPPLPAGDSDA